MLAESPRVNDAAKIPPHDIGGTLGGAEQSGDDTETLPTRHLYGHPTKVKAAVVLQSCSRRRASERRDRKSTRLNSSH